MPQGKPRRALRRARTAATFPGRLVEVEDRCAALEAHVVAKIDEMRGELAEIRALLAGRLDAEAEATALVGRLLQLAEARLDRLEVSAAQVPPPTAPSSRGSLGAPPGPASERSGTPA